MKHLHTFESFLNESQSPIAIIGSPIKIDGLEIAENDFPKPMGWDEATAECSNLGDGWRLPTIEELKTILNFNKTKIPNLNDKYNYWSSTEHVGSTAWFFNFNVEQAYNSGKPRNYARAVRS